MQIPSMRELLEAGVHFGHQVKKWNPKMSTYIFTARNGVHILDLAKTVDGLSDATEYVKNFAANNGQIMFLATKKQAQEIVKEEAKRAGVLYMTERWVGGFLTNFEIVSKSIKKLSELKEKKEKGEFENYTKKEQLLIDREIAKLERWYGGVEGSTQIPDAIYIVDCKHEDSAVREANKKGVPIVAICDTNSDPTVIDYPIPGNDDAIKAIKIITATIADAYLEGKKKYIVKSEEQSDEIAKDSQEPKIERDVKSIKQSAKSSASKDKIQDKKKETKKKAKSKTTKAKSKKAKK
jgi:small subunit ribosomal protein S2